MDSSAHFSFCNGLDFSAHVRGWIHPPFFNLAMGWIPPPMFVSFCNGLDSSTRFLI
jgi:hypothetical protein